MLMVQDNLIGLTGSQDAPCGAVLQGVLRYTLDIRRDRAGLGDGLIEQRSILLRVALGEPLQIAITSPWCGEAAIELAGRRIVTLIDFKIVLAHPA